MKEECIFWWQIFCYFVSFFWERKKSWENPFSLQKKIFKQKIKHFCKIKKMVLKIYNNAISLHVLIMKEDFKFPFISLSFPYDFLF
jgi:hypothetical protein